jgi:hypothetical protein
MTNSNLSGVSGTDKAPVAVDQIRAGLAALLPKLQENRDRWPLWTYDRHRWKAIDCPWLDRWRFSSKFQMWSYRSHTDRPHKSAPFQAWLTLAVRQTAPVVPLDLIEPLASIAMADGLLDVHDEAEFQGRLVAWVANLAGLPAGGKHVVHLVAIRAWQVLNDPLLIRFLARAGALKHEGTATSEDTDEKLAVAFCGGAGLIDPRNLTPSDIEWAVGQCRALGLLSKRRDQRHAVTDLDWGTTVRELDREAREIVRSLRKPPPADVIALAQQVIETDPWSKGWKPIPAERVKRGEKLPEVLTLARWLSHPFLFAGEIETVLKELAARVESSACRLVKGRFAGAITARSYAAKLSGAKAPK